MKPIHDETGEVVAWLDGNRVVSLAGEHLLWVDGLVSQIEGEPEEDRRSIPSCPVYDYNGCQVGTFGDGFFRDSHGDAVAFVEGSTFGPVTPNPKAAPIPPVSAIQPSAPLPSAPHVARIPTLNWSGLSWEEYSEPGVRHGE